ncbi:cytochrome c biogenesis ATP-binding export protein CcmA [Polynucleobacter sp. TUM22923]|uniref:cytochrome c biogenesis heme-transporting ATPase CcmA n=1 Tax=Polynucleobacter sp. TUM22923 TaxID=3022126 RepID=UPI0025741E1D|nr:cytochrome c biogenesis heme-transporting ATPase CcmA [Polynucleobacter sp. TUM22923]BDX22013.1 cytochrome c biogenesis ATP-binding export protein CcmA [Polynucleobacter sp. TUM22923]
MTATTSHVPSSPLPLLEARGVTCVRGSRELFTDLSLTLSAGECMHIRGENGVGKTSLLRLLTGLSSPESGEILWAGKRIQDEVQAFHRRLLFLGHRDALKEDLTSLENLLMYAAIDDLELTEKDALAALHQFGLRARADLPVSCLSAGQKKRVLMARMVSRQADIWILDEPFNTLDVAAVQELQQLIAGHLRNNGLVVFTSHQHIEIPGLRVLDL